MNVFTGTGYIINKNFQAELFIVFKKFLIMSKLADALKNKRILVSDGAWGTFLMHKGLVPGECPELWNDTRESDVFDIALSYVNAGADIILTNSFGGSRSKLSHYNLKDRCTELNRLAAAISRKAAGDKVIVLGSMGPTGKFLITGDISEEQLYKEYKEQALALVAGGADGILAETMSDLGEAIIAVKAAKENTSCEVVCTLTYEKIHHGEYRTMMGVSPAGSVEALIAAGADVIGANCGNGTADMIDIVKQIRSANEHIPILIHANAGLPVFKNGKNYFPETPDDMAQQIKNLIEAGANIIGGCCGTTPEHIKKIVEIIG